MSILTLEALPEVVFHKSRINFGCLSRYFYSYMICSKVLKQTRQLDALKRLNLGRFPAQTKYAFESWLQSMQGEPCVCLWCGQHFTTSLSRMTVLGWFDLTFIVVSHLLTTLSLFLLNFCTPIFTSPFYLFGFESLHSFAKFTALHVAVWTLQLQYCQKKTCGRIISGT